MRKIKFRGRDIDSGEFVYGDLIHDDAGVLIFNGHYYRVDKESVAQLVGYDKDNREIYEGDEVIRIPDKLFADGTEAVYRAMLFGVVKNPKNGVTKHDIEACKFIGKGNDD